MTPLEIKVLTLCLSRPLTVAGVAKMLEVRYRTALQTCLTLEKAGYLIMRPDGSLIITSDGGAALSAGDQMAIRMLLEQSIAYQARIAALLEQAARQRGESVVCSECGAVCTIAPPPKEEE